MDTQLRYSILGTQVIALLDRGASHSVDEVKEQIDKDGLFLWLHEKEPEIDQSLYNDEDRDAMQKFFRHLGDAADARRKYGIEDNGLCLLLAYCFEGLQHEARG
jgi:hypothetical protein